MADKLDMRLAYGVNPPSDLCKEHRRIWTAWQEYGREHRGGTRDWSNPDGHVMDNRTPPETRLKEWCAKAREQLDLVEEICRSGKSPQCSPKPTTCPTCQAPEPRLHPATQAEGEVTHLCPDPFHTPQNGATTRA